MPGIGSWRRRPLTTRPCVGRAGAPGHPTRRSSPSLSPWSELAFSYHPHPRLIATCRSSLKVDASDSVLPAITGIAVRRSSTAKLVPVEAVGRKEPTFTAGSLLESDEDDMRCSDPFIAPKPVSPDSVQSSLYFEDSMFSTATHESTLAPQHVYAKNGATLSELYQARRNDAWVGLCLLLVCVNISKCY